MNTHLKIQCRLAGYTLAIFSLAGTSTAQSNLQKEREFVDSAGAFPWIPIILVAVVAIVGAVILWKRSKKASTDDSFGFDNREPERISSSDYEEHGVDAEKELEWFRKAKKSSMNNKIDVRTGSERRNSKRRISEIMSGPDENGEMKLNSKQFQEKMRRMQFAQLPVNSFIQLTDARSFDPLPLSADPALLSAIEQANEEYEEDEAVRELAVRILTAFRSRNSVEALSQIALYDLSSNLRSKAVQILTDFDHESVFEALLLACADPTREVRAAAARGLFRLSFDRAEAWKRIIATHDEFRMKHAVRAAIESGIAQKSFDRLIHEDMRIAYEAFALVGLLIRSGETDAIFDALQQHADERVRFALLHVLKVVKDEKCIQRLESLLHDGSLPEDMTKRVIDTIKSADAVPA